MTSPGVAPRPGSRFTSRRWRTPADTGRMQALASARLMRDWPQPRIHPGDLAWWEVLAHGREPGMTDRVRLWFEDVAEHELAGFGWFAPPAELDFLLASDALATVTPLVEELIAWATARREDVVSVTPDPGDGLRVWVSLGETAAIGAIQGHGHALEPGHGFVHFTGDLSIADVWQPIVLPEGFEVRPIDRARDLEGRVACGRAAFPGSTMTAERYSQTLSAPLYRRDLDLVVANDAGLVIAFALGWLDAAAGIVELEPVGVHPDWHRRGLGRAICQATLGAARGQGATKALIGADADNDAANALYTALGLRITANVVAFVGPRPTPRSLATPT
ncbi:MAG: GNAT family N-acetyltransferase [Candidatus Limnocylindrales bacterium]